MYKIVEDHPNYILSSDGHVYRINNGIIDIEKPLKFIQVSGFDAVQLDRKTEYIHKLVAKAFVNKTRPDRSYVFHIDGNKHNNDYRNLVWLTKSEVHKYANELLEYRVKNISNEIF